ncbi:hypothetical protein F4861DRAFT_319423 [Xylaria intraflava]|nr:hypothetical protein F4861DRAFT_319423 [Xylaria intraflava]
MSFNSSPYKPRPPPGQPGSSPFRSSSANKFRSSLVPLSRPSPARPLKSPTKLAKTPTAARNLFDTSAPRSESITQFAPDLPAEVTRFTPRIRKFARKGVSSGMSNINSTQPFEMKIPSPDPGLTGEALAKEVPDDPTRAGSIYADEFLAHKCPAHFDDLQRRQFFCILDLRRLKYAADEIFSKKDWKLNVLSFAREFEKSRSLILLRYGLYEFKTVRPSAEVLQNWRSAYGIHSEPEGLTRASPAGRRTPGQAKSIKRKAEEDLAPNDAALTASTSNKNKRRNVNQEASKHDNESTPFRASKRKVEVSDEENEPQQKKLAKSTPTATSIFESILNKTRSAVSSPAKPTPESSSLGVSKPLQPSNGSLLFGSAKTIDVDTPSIPAKSSESVLFGHKVGSAPVVNTGNIFSYLSESPGSSSSNDDDEGRETNFEPEHDSEEQGQSTAVSTGTSTPPVQNGASSFTSKVKDAHGISGGSSKPSSQSGKGGLFDRITMGPDSQPVRASPSPDDKQESAKESLVAPGKQTAKQTATPAKQPGDYTFNPSTTPISFSQPSTDVTKTSVAATVGPSEKLVKSDVPEPKAPVSIFGASTQATSAPKSSEAAVSIFDTPKPAPTSSTSIFGAASTPAAKPKSSETPISIFDPQNLKPAPASVSFGAPSTPAAKPNHQKHLFPYLTRNLHLLLPAFLVPPLHPQRNLSHQKRQFLYLTLRNLHLLPRAYLRRLLRPQHKPIICWSKGP